MKARKILMLETIVKALGLSDNDVRSWAENRPVSAAAPSLQDELWATKFLADQASASAQRASKTVSQTGNYWAGH